MGLTYGDEAEAIKTTWSLAAGPDGTIYAGVEPAGLFRSADGGRTWSHVEGLTNHPTRPTWQPGNGGLILHTIVPHATDADRVWVGISAVGVFETRDGGVSWEPRNSGVRADFNPDPHPVTGQCVHKFAAAAGQPETLYQQNHCGVYRTDDGGVQWTEITAGLPGEFGFPLVTDPRDPDTAWVIPLNGADRGRYMPDASAAVWRTSDRGATWTRSGEGLPQQDAYLSVLREAMARDTLDPVGIAFGTGTGQVWHSADAGISWRLVTSRPAGDLVRRVPRSWTADGASWRRCCCRAPCWRCSPARSGVTRWRPATVASALEELERAIPGIRDRLVQPGPRLRPHINVFVDGEPADLSTAVGAGVDRPRDPGRFGRGRLIGPARSDLAAASVGRRHDPLIGVLPDRRERIALPQREQRHDARDDGRRAAKCEARPARQPCRRPRRAGDRSRRWPSRSGLNDGVPIATRKSLNAPMADSASAAGRAATDAV